MGREAVLSCVVEDLATFKVAWLRVDTQTILTIHSHVITKNHRISVTHPDEISWYLRIRDVKETDRGFYMCQINTDPMKSQVGFLDVVVPPDILDYPTSADMVVKEGSNVTLRCAASGSPTPTIMWRKETSELISLNNEQEVTSVEGPLLNITRVNRLHMGPYLCIASNGVPPSVSKRIMLIVHFPPMVTIHSQLVGAQIGQSVTFECHSEAYPKGINLWKTENDTVISKGTKYDIDLIENTYKTLVQLTIKSVSKSDFGAYRCITQNPLGDMDGTIKLYEIPSPTTLSKTTIMTTTITTTTIIRLPDTSVSDAKKKITKFKNESNLNNIHQNREKNQKSDWTEQRKSSKITTIESGLASTIFHSSSSRSHTIKSNFRALLIVFMHISESLLLMLYI
ncbi:hypothetical protein PGB90_006745 [Kerria lacca]